MNRWKTSVFSKISSSTMITVRHSSIPASGVKTRLVSIGEKSSPVAENQYSET